MNEDKWKEQFHIQYKRSRKILESVGLLKEIAKGTKGIVAVDGEKYAFPTWETICRYIGSNEDFYQKKYAQGFTELMVVPFGLSLAAFLHALENILRKQEKRKKLTAPTKGLGKKEHLMLDPNEPVWFWERYHNADIEDEIVYSPQCFTREKHNGQTKHEMLLQTNDDLRGYLITILEGSRNIPRKGSGKRIGGRKQVEAGRNAHEYLNALNKQTTYNGETGQFLEEWITQCIDRLSEFEEIIDDYQGSGSGAYLLGMYSLEGGVPHARWSRIHQQAYIGRYNPAVGYGNMGARFVIRIK